MFTPINITQNWDLLKEVFKPTPVNKGNQWENPAIIAKTAPSLLGLFGEYPWKAIPSSGYAVNENPHPLSRCQSCYIY